MKRGWEGWTSTTFEPPGKSEQMMNLSTKLKNSTNRRRAASERRSLQRVLVRVDAGLRNELIEMHELSR
jgi:hypothetical protein